MTLPKPPEDEQDEIVRRVDAMLVTADRLAARIDRVAATLDYASNASLTKAFRGQLVPTEAAVAAEEGRDFESAEQLLARLTAAVASTTKRPQCDSKARA